jgi:hypothetical protein
MDTNLLKKKIINSNILLIIQKKIRIKYYLLKSEDFEYRLSTYLVLQ